MSNTRVAGDAQLLHEARVVVEHELPGVLVAEREEEVGHPDLAGDLRRAGLAAGRERHVLDGRPSSWRRSWSFSGRSECSR